MFRPKSLSLVNKRRTLRAQYANTQAWPHACVLSATFDKTGGRANSSGTQIGLGSPTGQAAIFPGAAMKKLAGEQVTLATASTDYIFGLMSNFVGGNLDDIGDALETSVWRGRGGTFEVLAPVFDPALSTVDTTDPTANVLVPGAAPGVANNTQLIAGSASAAAACARVLDNLSSTNAIVIELLVP